MGLPINIKDYIIAPLKSTTTKIITEKCGTAENTLLISDFIINIKDYEGIIPIPLYTTISNMYMYNKRKVFLKDATIMAPNLVCSCSSTRKTFNFIIKYFNTLDYYSSKVHTSKNIYYIGNGVIFDDNLNPLILYCKKVNTDVSGVSPNIVYAELHNKWNKPKEAIIYINPKVFIDQKDLINKGIIQKIIPTLMEDYCKDILKQYYVDCEPKIIVSNEINDFINKVSPPSTIENIDDTINDLLLQNLSDMDNCFYLDDFKTK